MKHVVTLSMNVVNSVVKSADSSVRFINYSAR